MEGDWPQDADALSQDNPFTALSAWRVRRLTENCAVRRFLRESFPKMRLKVQFLEQSQQCRSPVSSPAAASVVRTTR